MVITYEQVTLIINTAVPLEWTVQAIDYEGGFEIAMFSGPDAEKRARRYAAREYPANELRLVAI